MFVLDGSHKSSSIAFQLKQVFVAIVIPDEEYVRKNYKSDATTLSFVDLCKDEKLKDIILSDLVQLAKKQKLQYYKIPSNIHLHHELFSQKNELLTITFKTRRMNARKQFQSIVQSLYETGPIKAKQK